MIWLRCIYEHAILGINPEHVEQMFHLRWHIRLQQDATDTERLCADVDDIFQSLLLLWCTSYKIPRRRLLDMLICLCEGVSMAGLPGDNWNYRCYKPLV